MPLADRLALVVVAAASVVGLSLPFLNAITGPASTPYAPARNGEIEEAVLRLDRPQPES